MKSTLLTLALFLAFVVCAKAQIPTDAIIYLRLNGSANDASGNGYNGVIYGTPAPTEDRFGVPDGAYYFNAGMGSTVYGTTPGTDFIDIPGTEGLNFTTGGLSLCGWVEYSGYLDDQAIVTKHDPCGIQQGYGIGIWHNQAVFIYPGAGCGTGDDRIRSGQTYADGQWHFVVGTYDGTTSKLYVDGVMMNSINNSYTCYNNGTIRVARAHDCAFFPGKIDDVRIFSRPLTQSEITSLFQEGNCLPPTISVSLSPNTLWPPNNKMQTITADVTTAGNCTPLSVQFLSVTANESIDPSDIQATNGEDNRTFEVRTSRNGYGNGRVYTATYIVTDASGNSDTSIATVTVPHDRGLRRHLMGTILRIM